MNRLKISDNFSLSEFECRDGSNLVKLDEELITKLQKLRETIGKPITINSGYRTPEYNKKIGGAPESQHMLGKAADIKVIGMTPTEVAMVAEKGGFRGIGIYDTFTHVDVRPKFTRWDLRTKK